MLWQIRHYRVADAHIVLLTALIVCIGIGSFLFHTFATGWAALADVIPIMLFQLCYLYVYGRCFLKAGRAQAMIIPLGFIAVSYIIGLWPGDTLNGSIFYGASVLFLTGVAIYHQYKQWTGKSLLIAASVLFLISLTFRTIDEEICDIIPFGTHFMWHILNGVVLFLLVQVLVNHKRQIKD